MKSKLAEELQGLGERLDSNPDVVKIRERRTALLERKNAALEALAAVEAAHAAGAGKTSRERAIAALAAGQEPPAPGPLPDEVRDARKQAELFGAAVEVLGRQENEVRSKVGMELARGLRPRFAEEWRGLTLAAVAFSEAAAALEEGYDLLRSGGISFGAYCPVANPLGWCDGRDRDSKINRFVDEIISEYGLSIPRKVLDAAEAERLKLHHKAEERKRVEREAQEARWAQARKRTKKAEHDGFVKVV